MPPQVLHPEAEELIAQKKRDKQLNSNEQEQESTPSRSSM
jgi:hypothetical protein